MNKMTVMYNSSSALLILLVVVSTITRIHHPLVGLILASACIVLGVYSYINAFRDCWKNCAAYLNRNICCFAVGFSLVTVLISIERMNEPPKAEVSK
jgi:hypothetical protein